LTIVTLGFGQLFLQLALTMTRIHVPGRTRPVDFTHGPNGINNLDNIRVFGYEFTSTLDYYYLFFGLLVLVYTLVHHLNRSRIGRSWRALREDELAAEAMGIPTRRLKLLAFAVGAAIAALAGSVDAAFQGNVIPNPRYGTLTLINLYGMVVLGGVGSLPGAVLGAFSFVLLPELLRDVTLAGYLFYGTLLATLAATVRPWSRLVRCLGLTLLGGLLLKVAVNRLAPWFDGGYPPTGSLLNGIVQSWLVIPTDYTLAGNVVTGAAVLILLGALLLHRRPAWHYLLVGVSIYALAFAWETTLATNPAATRILIVGLTLVVLMIKRPQGLLGKMEVKIV
jgi:ABC-type branched-subunit amino acid transport system permease subunit